MMLVSKKSHQNLSDYIQFLFKKRLEFNKERGLFLVKIWEIQVIIYIYIWLCSLILRRESLIQRAILVSQGGLMGVTCLHCRGGWSQHLYILLSMRYKRGFISWPLTTAVWSATRVIRFGARGFPSWERWFINPFYVYSCWYLKCIFMNNLVRLNFIWFDKFYCTD